MNGATGRVASPGPPLVSRYGSSMIWAVPTMTVTATNAVTGLSIGTVMLKKVRSGPAPSAAPPRTAPWHVLQPGEEEDGQIAGPEPQHQQHADLRPGRVAEP